MSKSIDVTDRVPANLRISQIWVDLTCIAIVCAIAFTTGCARKQWQYSPPAAPSLGKDFDAHWDPGKLDPNGAPKNPEWSPQLQGSIPDPNKCDGGNPYSSPCTDDKPFMDPPSVFTDGFCLVGKLFSGSPMGFYGHADWMVAQYDGNIGWLNFASDTDYNLLLVPEPILAATGNGHGVTTNNNHLSDSNSAPRYLELEFASAETVAVFTTGFWGQFKSLGEAYDSVNPEPLADQLADLLHPGKKATLACGSAVGLFGLDCDHGCRSEIHPVYALAIQRREEQEQNEWAVFVRNWGTGGFCGSYNQELAESSLSLALPYSSAQPPTSVEVNDFMPAGGVSCPKAYFNDRQLLLNFTLPPPDSGAIAAMTVKVVWPQGAQPSACAHVETSELKKAMVAEASRNPARLSGEDYVGALLRGANQGKRPDVNKDILQPYLQNPRNQMGVKGLQPALALPTSCGAIPVVIGSPPAPTKVSVHRMAKDASHLLRQKAIAATVCQRYRKENLPVPVGTTRADLEMACRKIK